VDTGLTSNIGMRMKAIQKYVEDEDVFLANYTDGLSDVLLPKTIDDFNHTDNIASFVAVKPRASFHLIDTDEAGRVKGLHHVAKAGARINGGYFVMRPQVFDYIHDGEEMVEQPFQRLIAEQRLMAHLHDGYWACMDTFKERQELEDVYSKGNAPWVVWNHQDEFQK
jgi:glucose-1-phosphate cytidylyltransferase